MSRFLNPNIGKSGRIFRGIIALILLVGGVVALTQIIWLGIILLVSGGFTLFEALRGWCVMRACGFKTKL